MNRVPQKIDRPGPMKVYTEPELLSTAQVGASLGVKELADVLNRYNEAVEAYEEAEDARADAAEAARNPEAAYLAKVSATVKSGGKVSDVERPDVPAIKAAAIVSDISQRRARHAAETLALEVEKGAIEHSGAVLAILRERVPEAAREARAAAQAAQAASGKVSSMMAAATTAGLLVQGATLPPSNRSLTPDESGIYQDAALVLRKIWPQPVVTAAPAEIANAAGLLANLHSHLADVDTPLADPIEGAPKEHDSFHGTNVRDSDGLLAANRLRRHRGEDPVRGTLPERRQPRASDVARARW